MAIFNFFKKEQEQIINHVDVFNVIFHAVGDKVSHSYRIDFENIERHEIILDVKIQNFFTIDRESTYKNIGMSPIGITEYICQLEKNNRISRLKKVFLSLTIEVDLNNKFNYNVKINDVTTNRERFRTDSSLYEYKEFMQSGCRKYDNYRLSGENSIEQFRTGLIDYIKSEVYSEFEKEVNLLDERKRLYQRLNEFNSKIDSDYIKDIFGHISDLCIDMSVVDNNAIPGIIVNFTSVDVTKNIIVSTKSNQILSEIIEATERTKSIVDCEISIEFENSGFIVRILPKLEHSIQKSMELLNYDLVPHSGYGTASYGTASYGTSSYYDRGRNLEMGGAIGHLPFSINVHNGYDNRF